MGVPWGWAIGCVVVGAAMAASVGMAIETVVRTDVWTQDRIATVSSVATMGALMVAAVAVVFQVAFNWGRAWEELQSQRRQIEDHAERLEEISTMALQVSNRHLRETLSHGEYRRTFGRVWQTRKTAELPVGDTTRFKTVRRGEGAQSPRGDEDRTTKSKREGEP